MPTAGDLFGEEEKGTVVRGPTAGDLFGEEEGPPAPAAVSPRDIPPPTVGFQGPAAIPEGAVLPPAEPPPPFEQQLRESVMGPGGLFGPATVGAIAGGSLGGPAGAAGGGILGKGLEKLWANAAKDPMDQKDWTTELLGEQGVKELAWAGVTSGMGQGTGGAVGDIYVKGTEAALAPFAGKIKEAQKAVNEVANKRGVRFLASQKTGMGWQSQIESIPGRFPLGSSAAQKFALGQNKQMEWAVKKTIRQIDPRYKDTAETVGKFLEKGAQGEFANAGAYNKILWDGVDEIIDPATKFPMPGSFDISKIVALEEAGLRGQLKNKAAGAAENIKGLLTPEGAEVPQIAFGGQVIDPASLPAAFVQSLNLAAPEAKTMTFKRIRDLYSRLGNLATNHPDPGARRGFARMFAAVDEDIRTIAESNPGLEGTLGLARSFYKNRMIKDFLDNETFKNITEKDASLLAGTLLGPKVSIEEVRRIKRVLPKEGFERLKAGMLVDILDIRSRESLGKCL